jgi:hypothetical protein
MVYWLISAALRLQIYISLNRLDLAKKELSSVNADSTLGQLMEAWVAFASVFLVD